MNSLQFVTGYCMVELIGVKPDHLKFPSMMVAVAFDTSTLSDLIGGMISSLVRYERRNYIMAIQALFIGNLFTQKMAFCAV